MRDIVFFLVLGPFVWAAVVVGIVLALRLRVRHAPMRSLDNQDECLRLEWRQSRNVSLLAKGT